MSTDLSRLKAALAGRYTVERELGQGGMATVYLAVDVKHDRRVAIKVMRSEIAASLGGDRFLREIQLAARLQHPHILMLIDSGEVDGVLYYVMPYVEGESLATRLARERQLPLDDAVQITREVASALREAHSQGVIHRDIKPDNILLSGGHAMVMDFGIARALSEAGGESLTETGIALGTPAYMSPEQSCGEEVDGRTDVYALGCVLYEMITGEPPYTGPTAQAIIAKSLADSVPSMRRVRGTVSPTLDAVTQRALAKVPADRFATGEQLIEALSTAGIDTVSSAVLPPVIPSSGDRVPRRWGRHQLAWLFGAVFVVIAAGWAVMCLGLGPVASDGSAERVRMAVLPFENQGPGDDAYLAQGITEEISSRLSQLSGLSVIARTGTMRYQNTDKSAREIGSELGVEYLLSGTVRWSTQADGTRRVRVSPQLVLVSDETRVWGESYDADMTDVFALEADLAERVAQALDVTLLTSEQTAIRTAPTDNALAYQEYGLGRHFQARNDGRQAIEHYQNAIDLDPDFALAYAGLADAYHYIIPSDVGGMLREKMDNWARAEQAARRALVLDSTLGAAHVSLAFVQMSRDLDWGRAEEGLKRGLALDQDYAQGHSRYYFLLMATGRLDSALAEAERAVNLDPLSPHYRSNLSGGLTVAGRYDEAMEQLVRVFELDSAHTPSHFNRAVVHSMREEWDAAAAELGQLGLPAPMVQLFQAAALDPSRSAQFVAFLDRAGVLTERQPTVVAFLLMILGETERSMDALERGVDDRAWNSVMYSNTPLVKSLLGDDERFQALLRRMGVG
jgi:serine/threonine-protein kinase